MKDDQLSERDYRLIDFGQKLERSRAARIARTQYIITPNSKECGEQIARLIEKEFDEDE